MRTYVPTVEPLEDRRLLAAGPISEFEQHLHEVINWVRANPTAAAARFGVALNEGLDVGTISADPKQPLARNPLLRNAITDHVKYLQQNNEFSHIGADNSTFIERIEDAGYVPWTLVAENIVWRGTTGSLGDLFVIAEGLVDDWFHSSGHRANMLRDGLVEAGTSLITGPFTYQGTTYNAALAGQDFGTQAKDHFITGAGCEIRRTTFDVCDVTAALAGVTVKATDTGGISRQAQTDATGAYDLAVPDGTWDVVFSGGSLAYPVEFSDIVVSGENVPLDFAPVSPFAWQNPRNPLDVNNDTFVSPADVLAIINSLNLAGSRPLSSPPVAPDTPPPYYDARGDDFLSPLDALVIINYLNEHSDGEGESDFSWDILAGETTPDILDREALVPWPLAVDYLFAQDEDR